MQGLRIHVYSYLSVAETKTKVALLSRREREVQVNLLRYLRKHQTLHIDTWNNRSRAYELHNRVGQCLAHGDRLANFKADGIQSASSIYLVFSVNTWQRCREHKPADELREFILELPDRFNDKRITLYIEEAGETSSRFDLDTFVSRINTHKPDLIFKEVVLRGNFSVE